MKELVVISGKGGTGKTSIVASFAALSRNAVFADCDVDAADLHLVLSPQVRKQGTFSGGKQARIMSQECRNCGLCMRLCRFDAVIEDAQSNSNYRIDPVRCEGCGVCAWFCPAKAIDFADALNGHWFVSDTRFGPMSHAKLGVAEENSGKLVTLVRQHAREVAEKENRTLAIVDGSPGIGCPVIASITGASLVLIVTEPTVSGEHDLRRVAKLVTHFNIPAMVCVNKYDINRHMSETILQVSEELGISAAGTVRYDTGITQAQVAHKTVVEYTDSSVTADIENVWSVVLDHMKG